MSNLICPFCQQELRSVIQQEGENTHTTWHCPKCELGKYKWACGNKTLWQALIDTRKALDVAVDILKEIDKTRCAVDANLYAVNHKLLNAGNVFCWTTPDEIHNALDQTTLEQKDVK